MAGFSGSTIAFVWWYKLGVLGLAMMDQKQIEKISALIKEQLLAGESVHLEGIGTFTRSMSRSIFHVMKKGERLLILLMIPYTSVLMN